MNTELESLLVQLVGGISAIHTVRSGFENISWRIKNHDKRVFIARISRRRSLSQVAQEAEYVRALRALGMHEVPEFCAGFDGEYAFQVADGVLTIQAWIPGNAEPKLSAKMREYALSRFDALISASAIIDPLMLNARPTLPTIDSVCDRLELISGPVGWLDRTEQRDRIRGVLNADRRHPLHADLHGGNLLWVHERLSGILDFDDCTVGAPEVEVAYIARGLAFESEVLNFAALTDIWHRFSFFFSDDVELFVAMIAYAVATCALALNAASQRRSVSIQIAM